MLQGTISGSFELVLPICDRLEKVRGVEVKENKVTVFCGNRNLGKVEFLISEQCEETEIELAVELCRFLIWKHFGIEDPKDRPAYYVCYCGNVLNGDQRCRRCQRDPPSKRGSPDWVVTPEGPKLRKGLSRLFSDEYQEEGV